MSDRTVFSKAGAVVASMTVTEADGTRWVDTGRSPSALASLASLIGSTSVAGAAEAILCWRDQDEAVFAHSVAAILGAPVSRVDVELGLMTAEPGLPGQGSRILLLATTWNSQHPGDSLVNFAEGNGHTVVGAISLLQGDPRWLPHDRIPSIVLERPPKR